MTEEDLTLYFEACPKDASGDGSLISAALGDIDRTSNMLQIAHV
jgi:DNA-binding phage protein